MLRMLGMKLLSLLIYTGLLPLWFMTLAAVFYALNLRATRVFVAEEVWVGGMTIFGFFALMIPVEIMHRRIMKRLKRKDQPAAAPARRI